MESVRQYSKEWFVTQGADTTKKIVDVLKNKDSNLSKSSAILLEQTFVGNVDDVKKNLKNLANMEPSSSGFLVSSVGVDNLLFIMDADGDGKITSEEFKNLASLDMDEFDDENILTLSAKDLHAVFENASKAQGGTKRQTGVLQETYTYTDGSKTIIQRNNNGEITNKSESIMTEDGNTMSTTYNYASKTRYERLMDKNGRVISQSIITPDKENDITYEVSYGSNGSRVSSVTTVGKVQNYNFDKHNNVISSSITPLYNSNGEIENTKQNSIGNCWVLAGVNALNTTSKGREIIKNSIKQNTDGSVTVTLKGVGKSYTYSAEQVVLARYTNKNKKYSTGDVDMNLIEMAVNDYRREQIVSGKQPSSDASINEPSEAGYLNELFYYMTGKKPSQTSSNIPGTMDKKMKDPDRYSITVSFKDYDEKFSHDDIMPRHAYNISRVTDDTIYLVNPHDSSKEIAYPKKDFYKNALDTSILDMSKIK